MPIDEYFGGHGSEVMSNMTKEYGKKKGTQIFYATANKRGAKPGGLKRVKMRRYGMTNKRMDYPAPARMS